VIPYTIDAHTMPTYRLARELFSQKRTLFAVEISFQKTLMALSVLISSPRKGFYRRTYRRLYIILHDI